MKNTLVWRRLLGYLKAHRLRLYFVILSAVISTAFMVLAPFLIGKVTTHAFFQHCRWNFLLGENPLAFGSTDCTIFDFTALFVFAGLWHGKNHCSRHANSTAGH